MRTTSLYSSQHLSSRNLLFQLTPYTETRSSLGSHSAGHGKSHTVFCSHSAMVVRRESGGTRRGKRRHEDKKNVARSNRHRRCTPYPDLCRSSLLRLRTPVSVAAACAIDGWYWCRNQWRGVGRLTHTFPGVCKAAYPRRDGQLHRTSSERVQSWRSEMAALGKTLNTNWPYPWL